MKSDNVHNKDTLRAALIQILEEPIESSEFPCRLAVLALAAQAFLTQQTLQRKHDPQQIEFERDYWQRKVGSLLTLIENAAPELNEAACLLVNTDRSGYLNADDAKAFFKGSPWKLKGDVVLRDEFLLRQVDLDQSHRDPTRKDEEE